MPAKPVNFWSSPQALLAPDIAAQQLALERRQAIVSALQQRDIKTSDYPGVYAGLAAGLERAGSAIGAGLLQRGIDKKQLALAGLLQRRVNSPNRSEYGTPDYAGPVPDSAPLEGGGDRLAGVMAGVNGSVPAAPPPAGMEPMAADARLAPDSPTMQPPMQAPMQQPSGVDPRYAQIGMMPLTGDFAKDYYARSNNSDEYDKNAYARYAPTDIAKTLIGEGLVEGSPEYQRRMADYNFKQTYVAPIEGRPGAPIRDPRDPSRIVGLNPQNIEGAVPIIDGQGRFTGNYAPAGGVQAIAEGMAGATSRGKAQGELVQTYNPETGQMVNVPKTTALNAGGGTQRGPIGPGPVTSALTASGYLPSGPPLGAQGMAAGSVEAYNRAQATAREVPQQVASLRAARDLINSGTQSGPFAAKLQEIGKNLGVDFLVDAKGQVLAKDLNRFVAQSAANVGLNGSDARLGALSSASPNMAMKPEALKVVIPTMIGLGMANVAYADAQAKYFQTHTGPMAQADFDKAWRNAYDPRMFTQLAKGKRAFQGNVSRMKPEAKQFWMKKYNALRELGVQFSDLEP